MAYKFDWAAAFIPGYGQVKSTINFFKNLKKNGVSLNDFNGGFWIEQDRPLVDSQDQILGEVYNTSRDEYLLDRAHTEQREDTAYQRAVEDMRRAGLNPYTISGGAPAASSSSTVGENSIQSKLQVLGYILDLQNLDARNMSIANNAIGNILRAVV